MVNDCRDGRLQVESPVIVVQVELLLVSVAHVPVAVVPVAVVLVDDVAV